MTSSYPVAPSADVPAADASPVTASEPVEHG
jgi:hypothetical protein